MTTVIEQAYDSEEHKLRRLDCILAMYKGEPKLVSTRTHPTKPLSLGEVYLVPFNMYGYETPYDSPDRLKIEYVNNKDLNIFDIPMGYIDSEYEPICIGRMPTRTTQVGLSYHNVFDVSGKTGRSTVCRYFYKNQFIRMLKNDFDSPSTCWSMVRSGTKGKAVSRDAAIGMIEPGLFGIYYRGNMLGITTGLDPTFSVLPTRKKLTSVVGDEIEALGFKLV